MFVRRARSLWSYNLFYSPSRRLLRTRELRTPAWSNPILVLGGTQLFNESILTGKKLRHAQTGVQVSIASKVTFARAGCVEVISYRPNQVLSQEIQIAQSGEGGRIIREQREFSKGGCEIKHSFTSLWMTSARDKPALSHLNSVSEFKIARATSRSANGNEYLLPPPCLARAKSDRVDDRPVRLFWSATKSCRAVCSAEGRSFC